MKHKIYFRYLFLVLSNIILPLLCLSQLRFWNKTSKDVYISIYWLDGKTNQWQLNGWFKVVPGFLKTILLNPLDNSYVYYYARTGDSSLEWKGDGTITKCLPNESFQYGDYNYCPDGFTRYSFRTINTGGQTKYIQELTSDDYPYVPPVSSNQNYSRPRSEPTTQSQPQPQSSSQQSQTFNLTPTAWTSVYIDKQYNMGIFNYYIANANKTKDVWVTYERIAGNGSVIETNKIKVKAGGREYIGTDDCGSAYPNPCYYAKEDAYFAN